MITICLYCNTMINIVIEYCMTIFLKILLTQYALQNAIFIIHVVSVSIFYPIICFNSILTKCKIGCCCI